MAEDDLVSQILHKRGNSRVKKKLVNKLFVHIKIQTLLFSNLRRDMQMLFQQIELDLWNLRKRIRATGKRNEHYKTFKKCQKPSYFQQSEWLHWAYQVQSKASKQKPNCNWRE